MSIAGDGEVSGKLSGSMAASLYSRVISNGVICRGIFDDRELQTDNVI